MPYGPPPDVSRASRKSRKESRSKEPGPKPVRITVDLSPDDYQELNRWLAKASVELDQPVRTMTLARGIRAMIQATATDQIVNDVVLGVMRAEQS